MHWEIVALLNAFIDFADKFYKHIEQYPPLPEEADIANFMVKLYFEDEGVLHVFRIMRQWDNRKSLTAGEVSVRIERLVRKERLILYALEKLHDLPSINGRIKMDPDSLAMLMRVQNGRIRITNVISEFINMYLPRIDWSPHHNKTVDACNRIEALNAKIFMIKTKLRIA